MKELFRERDFTRVGLYRNMLETEGIPAVVLNENVETMTTMVPIPDFFPALCVVNDEDYERAVEVLEQNSVTDARLGQQQRVCPACQERSPGNFETCWSCGADLLPPGERLV
ncbi:putative signal transducing protein [Roseimicrobium gellanilyticum]|uniref:Putative signal transducing protein n=1 Tax=Roseimicrobium gellanilyticum TaxID=748857 RepID=A0A366HTL0_9BACT|nr:DUF2007 domain-containing protein [Roseimicrobium gellanilyticum]RBP46263.1 putative signal transducing protein [Roseimicrobium gellanilyticum]